MQCGPEDRNQATVVHGLVALSGLASLVSWLGTVGMLAMIATVVLYFVWKSKGEFVARHAKQAAGLQVLIFLVGLLLGFVFGGAAFAGTMAGGFGTVVAMLGVLNLGVKAIGLAALIFGVIGVLKAQNGELYTYPVVGAFIDKIRI